MQYIVLDSRTVLTVGGEDRADFLQGLISNDIVQVSSDTAIWAALLTPQGKYLHDFFIVEMASLYYLDCEALRVMDLGQRLSRYKLHSKVELGIGDSFEVFALLGHDVVGSLGLNAKNGSAKLFAGGVVFVDPRLAPAGVRMITPKGTTIQALRDLGFVEGKIADYERLRLMLGLPDGSRDLLVEKSTLLESNFEELHGLDWDKGCYMGQELTARTKYRGLARRRLMPIVIDGPIPEPGTLILAGDSEAGEVRSAFDGVGLALLRLDRIEKSEIDGVELIAGAARITPKKPEWARY
jgi:folate-binding protein YgfZ